MKTKQPPHVKAHKNVVLHRHNNVLSDIIKTPLKKVKTKPQQIRGRHWGI